MPPPHSSRRTAVHTSTAHHADMVSTPSDCLRTLGNLPPDSFLRSTQDNHGLSKSGAERQLALRIGKIKQRLLEVHSPIFDVIASSPLRAAPPSDPLLVVASVQVRLRACIKRQSLCSKACKPEKQPASLLCGSQSSSVCIKRGSMLSMR